MYNRRGPPKSTPTSVLCQKCLKRGHYSYECKVAVADRPYKARPSRSQQLRNPKLAPKLQEETFDALQIKKGVADEELAKREAARGKRQRRDSGSSASGSVSGSDSDSGSSSVRSRKASKKDTRTRRRSPSYSGSDSSRSRSPSRSPSRSASPRSPRPALLPAAAEPASPEEAGRDRGGRRERSVSPAERPTVSVHARDNRMKSSDFFGGSAGADHRTRHRHSSRSLGRGDRHHRSYRDRDRDGERSRRHGDDHGRRRHDDDHRDTQRRPPPAATADTADTHADADQRERSLSPFSKRLAKTKEMQAKGQI